MRLKAITLSLSLAAMSCANGTTVSSDPAASAATEAATVAVTGQLSGGGALTLTPVANATPKMVGFSSPNVLSPELIESPVAQGSIAVENPQTVALADGSQVTAGFYGYDGDGPLLPAPADLPSATHKVEASKTEPDKNTYLVLYGQTGPDAGYDYGTHFIFQGHEGGKPGYISRINLDADGAHKVTVMAATDGAGAALADIDGSTWILFAQRLIFTTENANAPTYQATITFPSVVEDISGAVGRGGYEGVQNDDDGNLWIVEDIGGSAPAATPHSKIPNSFLYRFVPKHKEDLQAGKLQVLQVTSLRTGQPIAFQSADAKTADIGDLHTYGNSFATSWVTIHDTDVDGTTPFSANALAKAKLGTPFKRPENGSFRPGSKFRDFFFDETGDTSSAADVDAAFGGYGGVFKLTQKGPSADKGTLSLLYRGDIVHAGFDNCAFLSKNQIVFVEDAGDGLHTSRNALDSAWVLDVTADYANPANQPVRMLAEGRDTSATIDSGLSGLGLAGFQNEGDNEITGFHVSSGDPSVHGLMGASIPHPFQGGWRVFYTQQHGDNFTWEILAKPGCGGFED